MNILSNIDLLERHGAADGFRNFKKVDRRWPAFMRQCMNADLVIIDNNEQRKLYLACLLRPFANFRLISVDIVLRPTAGIRSRIAARIKRMLLTRVDRFILYFKNTAGYQRYYGIDRGKITYVPFKVNGLDENVFPPVVPDGEYVLCAGRTLRDVDTFVAAMAEAGCPGMLLQQEDEITRAHGTAQYKGALPPNLRLVVDTDDQLGAFLQVIAGAKIVVIPRYRKDIVCTGISTYLMAMALSKCVILTRGPGAEDVLTDQAMIVEPENPQALAQAIRTLWADDGLRRRIAAAGRNYAMSCGGTSRLAGDILNAAFACLDAEKTPAPAESTAGT